MLIEIPDPEVILSVILAFLVGLGGLYAFYKIRPLINTKTNDSSQSERLEYYERQLIDMKIRLDALELQGIETKSEDPNMELKEFLEKLAKKEQLIKSNIESKPEKIIKESKIVEAPTIDSNDVTEQVLQLVTDKAMTSRDIQRALNRSREHTSRFMKKLFEDGLVDRNTKTKPYTYSITEKGQERIASIQNNSIIA